MRTLVVNAGSSSLKLRVLDAGSVVASEDLPAGPDGFDPDPVRRFVSQTPVDAVGHRVVHGGTRFVEPARLFDDVVAALRDLTALAPLHQSKSLAGIDAVTEALPDLPGVACFDTAFHRTLPPSAYTYALPLEWRERWGLRRFGFHGLSHAYAARRVGELVGRPASALRTVVCHLGAGASLCAVKGGVSVDTTMGFTPLEGLVMATRSGSVDPGFLLWLQEQAGLSERRLADALEHESGLRALGGDSDIRTLTTRADAGDERATLAIDVYVHRLVAGVAAMAASLGGLDVLAFTGGVGENSSMVREQAARRLGLLDVAIDPARNATAKPDAEISADGARVHTVVIAAREDVEITRGVESVLGA